MLFYRQHRSILDTFRNHAGTRRSPAVPFGIGFGSETTSGFIGCVDHHSPLAWRFGHRLHFGRLLGRPLLQRDYHLVFLLPLQFIPGKTNVLILAIMSALLREDECSVPAPVESMPGGRQWDDTEGMLGSIRDGLLLVPSGFGHIAWHRSDRRHQMVDGLVSTPGLDHCLFHHHERHSIIRQGKSFPITRPNCNDLPLLIRTIGGVLHGTLSLCGVDDLLHPWNYSQRSSSRISSHATTASKSFYHKCLSFFQTKSYRLYIYIYSLTI